MPRLWRLVYRRLFIDQFMGERKTTSESANATGLNFRTSSESFGSLEELWIGAELAQGKLEFLPLHAGRNTQILHGLGDLRPA